MVKQKNKIVIFDDLFPSLLTTFRVTEFNYYAKKFSEVYIYSSSDKFSSSLRGYSKRFLNNKDFCSPRITKYNPRKDNYDADLFYTVFLNNTYDHLPEIIRGRRPFIFTLYPGGGFSIGNSESDNKLRSIFSASSFSGVIVTQKITKNYLIQKKMCPKEKIHYIYGGVFPSDLYKNVKKKYYGINKKGLDICFVANKYIDNGVDKGYDTFTKVSSIMSSDPLVNFHVVGNFEPDLACDNIKYHGILTTEEMKLFFEEMDIILSPNRAFILEKGAFDGFPTGACIEAAYCGVAVFATDPLKLNHRLKDKEDIIIIDNNPKKIVEKINYFSKNPVKLKELSIRTQKAFNKIFSVEEQMGKRISIMSKILNNKKVTISSEQELKDRILLEKILLEKDQKKLLEKIKDNAFTIENQKLIIKEMQRSISNLESELEIYRNSIINKVVNKINKIFSHEK